MNAPSSAMQSPAQAGTAVPEVEAENLLDVIDKQYFSPDKVATDGNKAVTEVNAICQVAGIVPVTNFDTTKPFPAGFGLVILPIAKRSGQVTKTLGVCFGAIPDANTIAAAEGGEDFIRTAIMDRLFAKLANAVRPRGDNNEVSGTIPQTIADFITKQERGTSLTTFRELAGAYVSALKQKGISFMTPQILRQVLSCTAFARQQLPKVQQTIWNQILDSMIAAANSKKLDPAILIEWKSTRDNVEFEVAELDFSDLAGIVAEKVAHSAAH